MKAHHGPYTAEIGGSSWSRGPKAIFQTIREAREWAEEYGTTADHCSIYDPMGRLVGEHRRDTSAKNPKWFRAAIPSSLIYCPIAPGSRRSRR
jgi:hypothetical protein